MYILSYTNVLFHYLAIKTKKSYQTAMLQTQLPLKFTAYKTKIKTTEKPENEAQGKKYIERICFLISRLSPLAICIFHFIFQIKLHYTTLQLRIVRPSCAYFACLACRLTAYSFNIIESGFSKSKQSRYTLKEPALDF